MKRSIGYRVMIVALAVVGIARASESPPKWAAATVEGRLEATYGDVQALVWQVQPLAHPVDGEKFAGSGFFHPLRTPSGFEWTAIQPPDHLHHFGLWWPWKYIEVDGAKYNTWEIQEGEGGHVARSVKPLVEGPDKLEWEFLNETVIKKPGMDPLPVISETARVGVAVRGDAEVLDIAIEQKAINQPVKIVNYRYSGFSWRGPLSWNQENGKMTTSEGKGRDDANGTNARWVVVSGPRPNGSASVLIMSAASEIAGVPEQVRVWDSKMMGGMPFVNFNPVIKTALLLDVAHPAVSKRKYRVIAADHVIDATEAEAEWKKWMEK